MIKEGIPPPKALKPPRDNPEWHTQKAAQLGRGGSTSPLSINGNRQLRDSCISQRINSCIVVLWSFSSLFLLTPDHLLPLPTHAVRWWGLHWAVHAPTATFVASRARILTKDSRPSLINATSHLLCLARLSSFGILSRPPSLSYRLA